MKWEEVKVKDICKFHYGKSLQKDKRKGEEYPVYGSAGRIGFNSDYLVEGPGLIVGRKGSVGNLFYEKENFYPIDTVFFVEPLDVVDLRYLFYTFHIVGFDKLNSDAAVPGLNRNIAYEQTIPLPPLPTQRKIAGILSAYDDLIENNLKRIKLLEEKALVLYRNLIQNEILIEKPLFEIADVIMGQSPPSNTYTKIEENNLPFHQGVTDFSNYLVSNKTFCTSPKKIANAGDILLSVRAPVGRMNFTKDKICIGRGLCSVRSRFGTQMFLYQQLKEFFFTEDVIGNGAIYNSVTKNELLKILLKTPELEIQKTFESKSISLHNLILNLENQNSKLREARDILLPRLMNGEIEV